MLALGEIIGIGIGVAIAIAIAIGFRRPIRPIAIVIAIPTDLVFFSIFGTAKCQHIYELLSLKKDAQKTRVCLIRGYNTERSH